MASETKTLLTLEEFERLPDDGLNHELSWGELIAMPPAAYRHGYTIGIVNSLVSEYLTKHRAGVLCSGTGFKLGPDTVRDPDLAYVAPHRAKQDDMDGWFQGAPDLAIEVVSPSNRAQDLQDKIDQYLAAGAKSVWVFYPRRKSIHVWTADNQRRILHAGDVLTDPGLFPDLSVPVTSFFD